MPKLFADYASYLFGELAPLGEGALALSLDELDEANDPHGQIMYFNGRKITVIDKVEFHPKALFRMEPKSVMAVGEDGGVVVYGKGTTDNHSIETKKGKAADRGPLRRGALLENTPIVVGMDRQAYRWKGGDQWDAFEQGLRPAGNKVAGYEAVAGFSLSDVYAGGWDGELVHWNGKTWRTIDSPTSSIIVNMCAGGDGKIYACGRTGLLLCGRDDEWGVIDHQMTTEDFWGIAWFKGKLYLSSFDGVFYLEKGEVQPVDFGDLNITSFYHLTASREMLLSIGAKDIVAFNGKDWTVID
jgi:hypothetical protein